MPKYGWLKEPPDQRDFPFKDFFRLRRVYPAKVDLRSQLPEAWQQGNLGSCVAQGGAGAWWQVEAQEAKPTYVASRLFLYYEGRVLLGTTGYDSGLYIRTIVKVLSKSGAPKESLWPYRVNQFTKKPPRSAYQDGQKHKATAYYACAGEREIRTSLADGYAVIFGFSVYESYESDATYRTGIVPMPHADEKMLGGHCQLLVGYDDAKGVYVARNSYGPGYGDKGHNYFPYDYVHNPQLACDFWSLRTTT